MLMCLLTAALQSISTHLSTHPPVSPQFSCSPVVRLPADCKYVLSSFHSICSKPLNTLTGLQTNISVFLNLPVKSQLRSWVTLTWGDHDLAASQLAVCAVTQWRVGGGLDMSRCCSALSFGKIYFCGILIIWDVFFLRFFQLEPQILQTHNVLFLSVVFLCGLWSWKHEETLLEFSSKKTSSKREMGFADLLEEVSHMTTPVKVDHMWCSCVTSTSSLAGHHDEVGGFGRYQWLHVTLISFPGLLMASQNLLNNFISGSPMHHCSLPANHSLPHYQVPDGEELSDACCVKPFTSMYPQYLSEIWFHQHSKSS